MRYVETLRTVGIFRSLRDEELAQIGELLEEKKFTKGQVIFRQGEIGDALYIVEAGRAKASTADPTGKEKVLALYSPGDFFGEMALLSGQTRSATLSAVTECVLLVLRRQAFETFLATNLQVMREMLAVISERQASTNQMLQRDQTPDEETIEGKVITIFSPKGGVGRTTLAVNLATAIRQFTGKQVALVDASLLFGDIGVMLNLEPRRSIADLLPSINELDAELVEGCMMTHPSGVKVLLAPPSPEVAELITADHMKLILSRLRELYDFIIIDTLPYLHDVTLGVLDTADLILVITTLEMPALKNVKVFLEVGKVLGYPAEKIKLVINRADSTGGIRLEDVEATIGTRASSTMVSDGRLATLATNRGVPFMISHRESQLAYDVSALAQEIAGGDNIAMAPVTVDRKGLAGLIGSLRTRFSSSFAGGQPAPKLADLIFGIGSVLGIAMFSLFLTAFISRIAVIANIPFPLSFGVNLMLWLSVVIGTFFTVREKSRGKGGGILGAAIGALCGVMILLGSVAMAMAGLTGGSNFFVVILLLIFYTGLGTLGGFLAEFRQGRSLRPVLSAS